ncbi:MAG: nicotinamide riboside transporter PnuC [Armatimonadota bacterium]
MPPRTPDVVIWSTVTLAALALGWGVWHRLLPIGWLELAGVITGVVCVILAVRQQIGNFPWGIASNLCLAVLFFHQHLYGSVGIQVIFLMLGIHGWILWGRKTSCPLRIGHTSPRELAILVLLGIPITYGFFRYFHWLHDPAPLPDAVTMVLCIAAQYQLNLKRVENWAIGMLADTIYIGMFLWQGLYLVTGLYAFYFVMCLLGYLHWRRLAQQSAAEFTATMPQTPTGV